MVKTNFKQRVFLFALIFILLEIGFVLSSSDGVYVLSSDNAEGLLRPKLVTFNSNGELSINLVKLFFLIKVQMEKMV